MKMNKESKLYHVAWMCYMKMKMVVAYVKSIPYRIPKKPLEPCTAKKPQIVVSFTTYPKRMKCVPLVVESILNQTIRPDVIVLYLAKEQFANQQDFIKRIKRKGVIVRLVDEDLKSHKKYYYAISEYPDSIIITIDDDIIYDKHLVEDLYNSWKRYPKAVSAKRVHKITFDEQKHIRAYDEWNQEYQESKDVPLKELCATGCGGILYPPQCLSERVKDKEAIYQTCLFADDLWLKTMELMTGTPVVLANSKNYSLQHIWGTVEDGLAKNNVVASGNDEQIKSICEYLKIDFYKLIFNEA